MKLGGCHGISHWFKINFNGSILGVKAREGFVVWGDTSILVRAGRVLGTSRLVSKVEIRGLWYL